MRALMTSVSLALFVALAGGCSSNEPSHPHGYKAEHALDSAERSGADPATNQTMRIAKLSRDQAHQVDTDAIDERNEAAAELRKAEARARHAESVRSQTDTQLAEAQRVRDEHASALGRLEQRRSELLGRGMSEAELANALDPEIALERARLAGANADVALFEQQRNVADLEAKDADLTRKSAQARIDTSEQRRKLAAAHYTRAEYLAKTAEAEKLAARTTETRERLKGVVPAGMPRDEGSRGTVNPDDVPVPVVPGGVNPGESDQGDR